MYVREPGKSKIDCDVRTFQRTQQHGGRPTNNEQASAGNQPMRPTTQQQLLIFAFFIVQPAITRSLAALVCNHKQQQL